MFQRKVAVINQDKCIGCGRCVSACPLNAIHINEDTNKYYIIKENCRGCMRCAPACPVSAIKVG